MPLAIPPGTLMMVALHAAPAIAIDEVAHRRGPPTDRAIAGQADDGFVIVDRTTAPAPLRPEPPLAIGRAVRIDRPLLVPSGARTGSARP